MIDINKQEENPSLEYCNRAVFFDRDGTISQEVGYVNHIDRFQLLPKSAQALRKLNKVGLLAILVTNQAGVARGYFEEDLIHQVHSKLKSNLSGEDAYLDEIYYCPHHPTIKIGGDKYQKDCNCRKPRIGMLEQAAEKFKLDLTKSYVVGDRYSDIEMAHRAGASGILVLTGYGLGEYKYQRDRWPRLPNFIAEHALEAVDWILKIEGISTAQST